MHLAENNIKSLADLIEAVIKGIGHDWGEVQEGGCERGGGLMSANTLFLRLEGPLQAWGNQQSKFVIRRTAEAPTKSGVIGMLCAALGVSRAEAAEAHGSPGSAPCAWAFASIYPESAGGIITRWAPGMPMRTAEGGTKTGAMLTRREYLCDASFLVALQGEANLIAELDAALNPQVDALSRQKILPAFPPSAGASARRISRLALRPQIGPLA